MSSVHALLELQNLECVRDSRVLFRHLDWRLPAGEVHALEGANGAGKSTLLRCIAGLYPDYAGTLQAAPFVYVGHKSGFGAHLTCLENLHFLRGLDAYEGAQQALGALVEDLSEAMEQVGLAGYEEVRVNALSAGQLRRLGLARLALSCAPLWLLDEPLTALDAAGGTLLGTVLEQHALRGGGALCATHQQLPGTTHARFQLTPGGAVQTSALAVGQ